MQGLKVELLSAAADGGGVRQRFPSTCCCLSREFYYCRFVFVVVLFVALGRKPPFGPPVCLQSSRSLKRVEVISLSI